MFEHKSENAMRFPEIGEVFADNYRIEKMLGSGGFSRVYMATQLDLERSVAIKILQPPLQGTQNERERDEKLQGLISRFEREARMVSKLKSPHTITMYAYGQDAEGQLFMSIEYVDGRTLSELVREEGALSPDRVAKIMRQVLVSLYEAHGLGMLHRDIKPQNIMAYEHIGQVDQVKLLDFGIVKLIGTESTRDQVDLTSDDTLVGTPRYMAPEYIRGEQLTASSDLYSLGLVMYELLVGERAIQADSSIQIIGKQLERESFYLPTHLATVDTALRSIINGMLEKNTRLRYDSAALILEDLRAREQNKYVPPPNAPTLQSAPTYKVDLTERLSDAITERRRADGTPEPVAAALPTVPIQLIEPRPLPLSSHDQDFGIEPLVVKDTGSKKRVLVGLVLLLFIVGSVGTLVAMNVGNDTASPSNSPQQVAVSKTATISAETKTEPIPSTDTIAAPDTIPSTDTIPPEEVVPPVVQEDPVPEEPDDTPPEDPAPEEVEDPLPEPRKTAPKKVTRTRKSVAKKPAEDRTAPKIDLLTSPPKDEPTKADPYKIIIAE